MKEIIEQSKSGRKRRSNRKKKRIKDYHKYKDWTSNNFSKRKWHIISTLEIQNYVTFLNNHFAAGIQYDENALQDTLELVLTAFLGTDRIKPLVEDYRFVKLGFDFRARLAELGVAYSNQKYMIVNEFDRSMYGNCKHLVRTVENCFKIYKGAVTRDMLWKYLEENGFMKETTNEKSVNSLFKSVKSKYFRASTRPYNPVSIKQEVVKLYDEGRGVIHYDKIVEILEKKYKTTVSDMYVRSVINGEKRRVRKMRKDPVNDVYKYLFPDT